MIIALIDNGSLEPAAHLRLRELAAEISGRARAEVEAVSWKHSDRISERRLSPRPETLEPWFRRRCAEGARDFLFVPFFLSPQGAIGSALAADVARLAAECSPAANGRFAPGLAEAGIVPAIVAQNIRTCVAEHRLQRPPVVVVDHGGPARISAVLRNRFAAAVAAELEDEVAAVAAASMESPEGEAFAFNRPLFAEQLGAPGFAGRVVVVAPLFLLPGRHAGPSGDLARIARAAEGRGSGLTVHFAGLVGADPRVAETLAKNLEPFILQPTPSFS